VEGRRVSTDLEDGEGVRSYIVEVDGDAECNEVFAANARSAPVERPKWRERGEG
jgi:hypothetical protein